MTPGPGQIAALAGVALVAGTIDAIAGGGGLLTLPALLIFGLPPHLALGTNKCQSVFGSFAAGMRFRHAGMIDARGALIGFPLGFVGSWLGAALQLRLKPDLLEPIILVLLVLAAVFIALRGSRSPRAESRGDSSTVSTGLDLNGWVTSGVAPRSSRAESRGPKWLVPLIAFALGAYDGFFGPGVGTFLIVSFTVFLAMPLARASAQAKVVNFASNLAAVSLFAWRGTVVWQVAFPMAASQLVGGWLGAHAAVRGGDRLVRWVVFAISLALALKLAVDLARR